VASADLRKVRQWAVAIIVGAAIARVAWAAWIAHADPAAVRSFDTPGYLWPARALIEAGRFSLSPTDPTPMFVRTPGYPAVLAPILWLTDSEWAISPIQAVVSMLAVAAVVLVGRRLVGWTAGLVAGAVVAVDPLQFVASGTILTEAMASAVLAAIVAAGAVVFALRAPGDVPRMATFGLGILVAVVTIVRPTFWFYPAVLVALLVVRFRGLPRQRAVTHVLVFLLPILLIVGGWQLRNHAAVGSWQVSGVSSINLYCYNAAEVEANVAGVSMDAALDRLGCPTQYPNPDGICTRTVGFACWSPDPEADGQGFDEWGRRGLDILSDHPVQTARVVGEGVVREVAGPGTSKVARYLDTDESTPLTMGLFLWNAALWAFAAAGAAAGLRSKDRAFWAFVIATMGYVILVSAGTAADARFRTPLVPLLALLAALGIQRSLAAVRRSTAPAGASREQPVPAIPAGRRTP